MSYIEGPTRSFANNAALSKAIRVALVSGYLAAADANTVAMGTMEYRSLATDEQATVRLRTAEGTRLVVANGAISAGAKVYAAASGKVASTGTVCEGIALEAASADGDLIEVVTLSPSANSGLLYSNTAASSAISNTTTETAFSLTYAIPANSLKAGDVIKVRYQGIATSTNSTDTLAIKVYIGGITGTVLLTGTATDVANNNIFAGEVELVIRTTGASGTLVAVGTHTDVPAASGTASHAITEITASTAIDTTAAQTVAVSATWSVASASNSVRLDILTVRKN